MRGKESLILNEIEILLRVSKGHPNIITLYDYFETPSGNLYLVLDYCEGGELFDRLCEKGNFYEMDGAHIIRTVVNAVAYLHSKGIVHRDIKPENILFRHRESRTGTIEETAKDLLVADFGLSKILDQDKYTLLMTTCGTPGYMAPEIIRRAGHGMSADMWSIGVLTFFLLSGCTPFESDGSAEEMDKILSGDFRFEPEEYWRDISDLAKDFIRKLLVVDPSKRMTSVEALEHPWLAHLSNPTFDLSSPQPILSPCSCQTADSALSISQQPDTAAGSEDTATAIVQDLPDTTIRSSSMSSTSTSLSVSSSTCLHHTQTHHHSFKMLDLLPSVRKHFNARQVFKKAVHDVVKAVNNRLHLSDHHTNSTSTTPQTATDNHYPCFQKEEKDEEGRLYVLVNDAQNVKK